MDILRKYKHFINETVDNNKEVKTLVDVPTEVIKISKEIAKSIYDEVKKPIFEICQDGILMKFGVSSQDFNFVEEDEPLTLEATKGVKEKRTYDVILEYYDKITETFEVQYIVKFEMNEFVDDTDDTDDNDEEDGDDEDEINYFNKRDSKGRFGDEFDFDEDEADKDIKKGKIKIDDIDIVEGDDEDE